MAEMPYLSHFCVWICDCPRWSVVFGKSDGNIFLFRVTFFWSNYKKLTINTVGGKNANLHFECKWIKGFKKRDI